MSPFAIGALSPCLKEIFSSISPFSPVLISISFERIKAAAKRIKENSQVFVVIGIGGSYLGARAAIEFLKSDNRKKPHGRKHRKTSAYVIWNHKGLVPFFVSKLLESTLLPICGTEYTLFRAFLAILFLKNPFEYPESNGRLRCGA